MKTPVILIFDAGKTNKKLLLFNEQYHLIHEETRQFEEIKDEDGFPCEDVHLLTSWIKSSFEQLLNDDRFEIKAVNFSGYGASFVYLNNEGKVTLPLYNYLKPFPAKLQKQFYSQYGDESIVSRQTASPSLGHLNSGLQLYRLKYEKPEAFAAIKYALHLPQYLSYILSGKPITEITSIGCHTLLWNFENKNYHRWVAEENIIEKFPAIFNAESVAGYVNETIPVGSGLHDSSSALIPYLASFHKPFVLLSTGTWCISLNPFNHAPLTNGELKQDCLCYFSYKGNPVKASRLFAGYEHEQQVKCLASHFNKANDYFAGIQFDSAILNASTDKEIEFSKRDLNEFGSYEEAYHYLIADITKQQVISTNLVLKGTNTKRIFVDGGFSKNQIYMHLLAKAFPAIEVYAASIPQASAIGAAMVIHPHWNSKPLPSDIIELKIYSVKQETA